MSLWYKYGPMTPPSQNPQQVVTFSECIRRYWISCRLVSSQIRPSCLLTYPFVQKWASSLKTIFWFTFCSYVSWILYGYRSKLRRKIPQSILRYRLSSCERCGIYCLGFSCTLNVFAFDRFTGASLFTQPIASTFSTTQCVVLAAEQLRRG